MQKKRCYEAPALTELQIICEQGFSLSGELNVPDGGENNEGGTDNWA